MSVGEQPLSPWDDSTARPASGAIRGGALIALAKAARQLLKLGVVVVLARLLSPEEFGIVAVLGAVFAVAAVFQELGLSAATVQRSGLSRQAVSTLYWINGGMGLILALVFASLTPWIAQFFQHPELKPLGLVMSLSFLINGFSVQRRALLQRGMQFARWGRIDFSAALAGSAAALLLAVLGAGYWALVGQILAADLVTLLLLVRAVPVPLQRPVWSREIREMLHFGGSMLGYNIVLSAAQNLATALLGRGAGAGAAGIYTRAHALATLPQGLLYGAAAHVALPRLARIREAEAEFATFYYQSVQLLALATVPVALAFGLFGDQIALLVYGPAWTDVSVVLQAFTLGLMVAPLLQSTGQVFVSRGESHRMLRWGLFGCSVIGLLTAVGARWGAVGVALGWSAANLLLLWPCLAYAFHGSPIRISGLVRSVWGIYGAAVLAAPAGWATRQALEHAPVWLGLPAALGVLLLAYLSVCYFAFGHRSLIRAVARGVFDRRGEVSG